MRKQPGFTLLATACLAVGIGTNASIFSLLNALLLRTLPVRDAKSLVVLQRGKNSRFSFPDYEDVATRFQKAGTLLATLPTESSLDRPEQEGQLVSAEAVTGNYARVLQIGTTLGDWFDNEDAPVAVISYSAWQKLFQGNPRVLGQQVRSETQWYTIVGVAPEDFTGLSSPTSTSIWVPFTFGQDSTQTYRPDYVVTLLFGYRRHAALDLLCQRRQSSARPRRVTPGELAFAIRSVRPVFGSSDSF